MREPQRHPSDHTDGTELTRCDPKGRGLRRRRVAARNWRLSRACPPQRWTGASPSRRSLHCCRPEAPSRTWRHARARWVKLFLKCVGSTRSAVEIRHIGDRLALRYGRTRPTAPGESPTSLTLRGGRRWTPWSGRYPRAGNDARPSGYGVAAALDLLARTNLIAADLETFLLALADPHTASHVPTQPGELPTAARLWNLGLIARAVCS